MLTGVERIFTFTANTHKIYTRPYTHNLPHHDSRVNQYIPP